MLNVKVTNRMSHEDYVAVYSDYPYALSRRHLLGICSTIVVCLVLILPTPSVWLGDQESSEPQLSQESLDYLAHDQSATEKAFAEEEHVSLPHQENYDDYDIPSDQFANTDNLDDMTSSAEAEVGGAYDYPDAITDSDIASSDWTMPPLEDVEGTTPESPTDATADTSGMLAQSSEQAQSIDQSQSSDTTITTSTEDATSAAESVTASAITSPSDAATPDSASHADEKLLAQQATEPDNAAKSETSTESTLAHTPPKTAPADSSSEASLAQSTTEQTGSEEILASASTDQSSTETGSAPADTASTEESTAAPSSNDEMLAQSASGKAATTATTETESAEGASADTSAEQQLAAGPTSEAASDTAGDTASTGTKPATSTSTPEKDSEGQLLASAPTDTQDSGTETAESKTTSTSPETKDTTPASETQLAATDSTKTDSKTAETVKNAPAAATAAADSKTEAKEQSLAKAQPAPPALPEGKWFRYTIAKGDNLSVIFKNLDLPYATLNRITKVAGRKDIALDVGEPIYFMIDKDNIVLQVVNSLGKDKQVRFARNNGEEDFKVHREELNSHVADPKLLTSIPDAYTMPLAAKALKERKDLEAKREKAIADRKAYEKANNINPTRPRLLIGSIEQGENFSRAARREGLTPTEIKTIAKLLQKKINVNKLKSGDNFRVLFTGIGTQSDICAISFSGSQGDYEIFLNPKDRNFYGENEYTPTAGVFKRFPLAGDFKVTSHFNPKRRHPVTRRISPHNGVDFKAKVGTPVYAPADGVVTFSGYQRAAGYYVIVRHANNYSTVYMHLSKSEVKKGAKVVVGQMIARTGNTGRTTGPHLHYEIRINDRPVNPLKVELPSSSHPNLVREQREAFANNVKVLKADLQNNSLAATR